MGKLSPHKILHITTYTCHDIVAYTQIRAQHDCHCMVSKCDNNTLFSTATSIVKKYFIKSKLHRFHFSGASWWGRARNVTAERWIGPKVLSEAQKTNSARALWKVKFGEGCRSPFPAWGLEVMLPKLFLNYRWNCTVSCSGGRYPTPERVRPRPRVQNVLIKTKIFSFFLTIFGGTYGPYNHMSATPLHLL